MYVDFYELKENPFRTNPNPRFLWLGEKYREALSVLKYGILKRDGFLLLTGDAGTGKTSLVRYLLKLIDWTALAATLPDPQMGIIDFLNLLAEEFRMGRRFRSKADFLIEFRKFLLSAYSNNKQIYLIIDEAQKLTHELLEQVRLLSNIELDEQKLLNVFLVGQNEVEDMLLEEQNEAFRQRITINHRIEHLTAAETKAYISHRLKVAGSRRGIFTVDACRRIFEISEGIPRLVNSVCDCALLSGYVKNRRIVDMRLVDECQVELRVPLGRRSIPEPE